ncbi:MAG: hypothetical protein ACREDF_01135, partial [Thermoplasmata archaeon]
MPRVVIIGDRNSGKTTFLGLLYAAQVKSGSDTADDFRFHANFESLDEITGVFQGLMSGSFPDSATKEGIREISFRLGYRTPGPGVLSRLRSRGWAAGVFLSFQFLLLRNLEDDMSRLRKGSSVSGGTLRDVLESDVIAILVDSTKLVLDDEEPHVGSIGNYDVAVEALLTAIQRSQERGGRNLLHPIFIFSKFDSVAPEALRVLNLEAAPPGVRNAGPRARYGQALLGRNLPKTMARVRAREPRGPKFATPLYFFTWVRTEAAV